MNMNKLFSSERVKSAALPLLLSLPFTSCANSVLQPAKTLQEWSEQAYYVSYDFERYGAKKHGLDAIAGIEFISTPLTDKDIETLAQLKPEIYRLGIGQAKITDKGIQYLSTITSLKSLNIDSTAITDESCPVLAKLNNLRTLSLEKTTISDTCISELVKIKSLTRLFINDTAIDGSGFEHFQSKIDEIYASRTHLDDTGLKFIGNMTQLNHLDISSTRITDKGLLHLTGIEGLRHLDLRDTAITSKGVKDLLAKAKKLITLHLAKTDLTDEVINSLSLVTTLKDLTLYNTKITVEGIEKLKAALPNTQIRF